MKQDKENWEQAPTQGSTPTDANVNQCHYYSSTTSTSNKESCIDINEDTIAPITSTFSKNEDGPIHPLREKWQDAYIEVMGEAPTKPWVEMTRTDKAKIMQRLNRYQRQQKRAEEESQSIQESLMIETSNDVRVVELNKTWTHIASGGKNYMVKIEHDRMGNPYMEFYTRREFETLLVNEKDCFIGYTTTGREVYMPVAEYWLKSPRKNLCENGLGFYPTNQRFYKGKLNAYFGYGVTPASQKMLDRESAALEVYLAHVKKIICSNNAAYYDYLIKWLAHMVQKPHIKPGVAIVVKSGQGSGKGSFVAPLGIIIGPHYAHPQNPEHVTGRFNAIMENKVLVFADEFFAGSKSSTDKLKGMITETTTTIERKGVDCIEVPSYCRIILATNHSNIIRVEFDERRYLYLEPDEAVKQDARYFDKLYRAIGSKNDEKRQREFASVLLTYLLSIDIKNFRPSNVPKTEALGQQKLDNLPPVWAWIYYCLKRGSIKKAIHNQDEITFETRLSSNETVEAFETWLKDHKHQPQFGDTSKAIGIAFKKLNIINVRLGKGENRTRWYEFNSLDDLRTAFEEYISAKVEW